MHTSKVEWKSERATDSGSSINLYFPKAGLPSPRRPFSFFLASSLSSPLRSTRTAPLPLAKLDFLSGFHDLKAREERWRARDFPCRRREHRNDTSIRKKGPSRTLSLSLRSILPLREIVILHFRSCTRKFPLQRIHDGGNRAPWASGTRISATARRNLFLFRPSETGERDIFPPKFPSLRI